MSDTTISHSDNVIKQTDNIMRLARNFGDVQAEHAKAVEAFASDRAEYAPIVPLSYQWTSAEQALRNAVVAALMGL
jgi:hypothetical protein